MQQMFEGAGAISIQSFPSFKVLFNINRLYTIISHSKDLKEGKAWMMGIDPLLQIPSYQEVSDE